MKNISKQNEQKEGQQLTPEQIIFRVEQMVKDLEDKRGRIFFFVADSNGKPMGSVIQIYEIAKLLKDNGYNAIILHESNKYVGVGEWLGEDYAKLPHVSVEKMYKNQQYQIKGSDIFVIPELYIKFCKEMFKHKIPAERIIICQHHVFVTRDLEMGENWRMYGIEQCIVSSNKMMDYLAEFQRGIRYHTINPFVSEEFTPSTKPQTPTIALFVRNPDDADRIIKTFYLKYPMFGWATFDQIHSMPKNVFAENMKKCCLAVWSDTYSTFGTTPLECMSCGVPVIISTPQITPEWAEDQGEDGKITFKNNAMYVLSDAIIPDTIAQFLDSWLSSNIDESIYEEIKKTPSRYSRKNFEEQTLKTFDTIYKEKIEKFKNSIEYYKNENNSTNSQ